MTTTLFDHVGGQPFFDTLVDRFYDGVESDAPLRAMYPDDLEPGKRGLALFLGQYFGGPTTYSDEKGHPRLRMRHVNFRIGPEARDGWVRHMTAAVVQADLDEPTQTQMLDYFAMAAQHMINV